MLTFAGFLDLAKLLTRAFVISQRLNHLATYELTKSEFGINIA